MRNFQLFNVLLASDPIHRIGRRPEYPIILATFVALLSTILGMPQVSANMGDLSTSDVFWLKDLDDCWQEVSFGNLSPRSRAAVLMGAINVAQLSVSTSPLEVQIGETDPGDELCVDNSPWPPDDSAATGGRYEHNYHNCGGGGTLTLFRQRLMSMGEGQAKLTYLHEHIHATSPLIGIRTVAYKSCVMSISPTSGTKDAAARDLVGLAVQAEGHALEAEATATEICELSDACPKPPASEQEKLCAWQKKVKNLCDDFAGHVEQFENLHEEFDDGLSDFIQNQPDGASCANSMTISGINHNTGASKTSGSFSLNDMADTLDRYADVVAGLEQKVAAAKEALGPLSVWSE